MRRTAIIISGLPASGKTTLGLALARRLGFRFLDKDDFLEALYEIHGPPTPDQRRALSQQADTAFETAASDCGKVVLVSHWRPRCGPQNTGTPTAWLRRCFAQCVEVHCSCPASTSAARFVARTRHPGHLDQSQTPDAVLGRLTSFEHGYPLGVGQLVTVETRAPYDIAAVQMDINDALGSGYPGEGPARIG